MVLENVFHKLEGGERDREHAAIRGTEEVFFAVSAASLTLVSIFAAVLFLGGIIGRFFESFAVVVTVGVLVSWFVSLTLTPMLASRVLRLPERHGRLYLALSSAAFAATEALYRRLLDWGLGHRGKVVLLTLLALGSAVPMFAIIPKEFASPPDDGRFVINFRTPLGTSIEASSPRARPDRGGAPPDSRGAGLFLGDRAGLGGTGQPRHRLRHLKPRARRDTEAKMRSSRRCASACRACLVCSASSRRLRWWRVSAASLCSSPWWDPSSPEWARKPRRCESGLRPSRASSGSTSTFSFELPQPRLRLRPGARR